MQNHSTAINNYKMNDKIFATSENFANKSSICEIKRSQKIKSSQIREI